MNILRKEIDYSTRGQQSDETFTSSDTITSSSDDDDFIEEELHIIWLCTKNEQINLLFDNDLCNLTAMVSKLSVITDISKCRILVNRVNNQRILLIVSDEFSQIIDDSIIKDNDKIFSIIIISSEENKQKTCSKIFDIYESIKDASMGIRWLIERFNLDSFYLNHGKTNYCSSQENFDALDHSFMYTQIIKNTLCSIHFTAQHRCEFAKYRRQQYANDTNELSKIDKFERNYNDERPIWWYIHHAFLYSNVNRALRTMDIDSIVSLGFFIKDLHQDIEQLNQRQFNETNQTLDFVTLYRGQALSEREFKELQKCQGRLIAFNQFLSTSRNYDTAHLFAESNSMKNDMKGVIFKINVDPLNCSTYFADISEFSKYRDEREVLFSMHSIFRIGNTQQVDNSNDRLWIIELILTNDQDKQLNQLTQFIENEFKESQGWFRLCQLMIKIAHFTKAEELCYKLFEENDNKNEKADIFNLLGMIKYCQGQYEEAIMFYRGSISLLKDIQSLNDSKWAYIFINLGQVFHRIGNYSEALSLYKLTLEIHRNSSSLNEFDWGMVHNNLSLIYDKTYKDDDASYHRRVAIEAFVDSLPANHPHMTTVFSDPYWEMNSFDLSTTTNVNYEKTLSIYEKALQIQTRSLPNDHPHLANTYNNIGRIYTEWGNYYHAVLNFKKALEIQLKKLSPDHSDLAITYSNFGRMSYKRDNYSDACLFFEYALTIQTKRFHSNHPDIIECKRALALAYYRMKQRSKALERYQDVLNTLKTSLSENHPIIVNLQKDIEQIKYQISTIENFEQPFTNLFAYNWSSVSWHGVLEFFIDNCIAYTCYLYFCWYPYPFILLIIGFIWYLVGYPEFLLYYFMYLSLLLLFYLKKFWFLGCLGILWESMKYIYFVCSDWTTTSPCSQSTFTKILITGFAILTVYFLLFYVYFKYWY